MVKQVLLLLTALAFGAPAFASVNLRVVSNLDGFEPFEAHVFHAGLLWTGRSRQGLGAFYRLEVYASDGQPAANLELGHSVKYLIPYGANSVVAIGVTANSENTAYTVVTRNGSAFAKQ